MPNFAGIDWGGAKHAVCVVDGEGQIGDRFEATHDRAGLERLATRLTKLCKPAELPIAIERPSGLLVDTLIDHGFQVVPIHPNVVKACRPRYRAACGKDDPGDAYLLADVLRTDGHRFRPLKPSSDAIKALRALSRTREDLVAERVAVANQLRGLVQSFWPGAAAIFANIESSIALAFLVKYPTPQAAKGLSEKRLASFLTQHGYSGCRTVPELLERLRAAPAGLASEVEAEAKRECVLALVAVLQALVARIKILTSRIHQEVPQTETGRVIMSFPRAGKVNAAQIVAEIGDDPRRFASPDHLAAEAGHVPVTYESGKRRGVVFRFACNRRLRSAFGTFADNSRHASPWAADVYRRARARGCDHPHAIRILARAWIRVMWRCWCDGKLYDPDRHSAARRLKAS